MGSIVKSIDAVASPMPLSGMRRFDAIVLGAGMVGIGTALNLLERGRSVALIDRRGPAEETSFGNAGLIQTEAVLPYAFPRHLPTVLGVLADRRTDARVPWRSLLGLAPSLLAYARHSSKAHVARTAAANLPLLRRALTEHERLMERAGTTGSMRPGGYLRVFRNEPALARAVLVAEAARQTYGVEFDLWDPARLAAEEPHLATGLAGAIHMPAPVRVDDPGDVGRAYAGLFEDEGGVLLKGDATDLRAESGGWSVPTGSGVVAAKEAVIALGPWSGEALTAAGGKRLPLFVKRGYHMHYGVKGNAGLGRVVLDEERGYVLGPNRRGIRLTTGAEFTPRDAPATPIQLARVEPLARAMLPLGPRLHETPWMGARPCLPDLLPAIGRVPGTRGLWANFGHHHLGFTLGPATGLLLSQMMTGESPYTDPAPYALERF